MTCNGKHEGTKNKRAAKLEISLFFYYSVQTTATNTACSFSQYLFFFNLPVLVARVSISQLHLPLSVLWTFKESGVFLHDDCNLSRADFGCLILSPPPRLVCSLLWGM